MLASRRVQSNIIQKVPHRRRQQMHIKKQQ